MNLSVIVKRGLIGIVAAVATINAASAYDASKSSTSCLHNQLSHSLQCVIENKGVEQAEEWLSSLSEDTSMAMDEAKINALGYQILYQHDAPGLAVKVFELNTHYFPKSANAFDSLAEAQWRNEQYDVAGESYRAAIALGQPLAIHHLGFLPPSPYKATRLPESTESLFRSAGNVSADTVLVFLQGGPDTVLSTNQAYLAPLTNGENAIHVVYPQQVTVLNPALLNASPPLTIKQSAHENRLNVDILEEVLTLMRSRHQQIVLAGHSYGASIVLEYLRTRDNLADKVVVMGLDLDEDLSAWQALQTGEYIRWEQGIKPVVKKVFGWVPATLDIRRNFDNVADNLTQIVRTNMQHNYLQQIPEAIFPLLTAIYASEDEANGVKSEYEVMGLHEKGARVIRVDGNHHAMLVPSLLEQVVYPKTAR